MFEQLNQSFQHVFGEDSAAAGSSTNVVPKSEGIDRSDMPEGVAGVDAIDYDKIGGEANQSFEGLGEQLKVVNSSEETEEEEEEEEEDDEEQDFGEDDDPDEDWEDDEDEDDWLDEDDDEEYWDDEDDEE